METERRSNGRSVAALAVVGILAIGFAAYYFGTSVATADSASHINSLQNQVTALQDANRALQAQFASMGSNSTLSETSAEGLYSNASVSVVTIQGYLLIIQTTFFGQVRSIESIQGSGFVIDYQNSTYLVTNNHVVDGATNITATFSDGNSYPARVVGTDPYRDLAILTTAAPPSELHPLPVLGSVHAVTVGESVFAIGSPFGLSGSMTVGIVSQVGRTITESNTQVTIPNVVQFSAAINPGNSGGPLLDASGDVIGITTAAVSSSQGLGFAIPASTLWRELPSLVTTGNYTAHPDLGISSSADMSYQLAQATGSNVTYGILVESVTSGGPASNAGLRGGTSTVTVEGQSYRVGGDVIVSIDGFRVVDSDSLAAYLEQNTVAGQTVQLGILRGGAPTTVSVTLGSFPSS